MSKGKDTMLTYAADFRADMLSPDKGMELVQKVLDVISGYHPSSGKNILCWALSMVIASVGDATDYSRDELIASCVDQITALSKDMAEDSELHFINKIQ